MVKMGATEEHPQNRSAHKIHMMNRRTGSITGVTDVISFDIAEVLLAVSYTHLRAHET